MSGLQHDSDKVKIGLNNDCMATEHSVCVIEDVFCGVGIAHGMGPGWSFARFKVALAWGQTLRGSLIATASFIT
jgi:hypothetical protein